MFSHLYKDYTVFLKTRDESLVQVNGTNIFVYLNDRLSRQPTTEKKEAEEVAAGTVVKKKNIPA